MLWEPGHTPWVGRWGNVAPGVDLELSLVVFFSYQAWFVSSRHCYSLYGHLFFLRVLWLIQ